MQYFDRNIFCPLVREWNFVALKSRENFLSDGIKFQKYLIMSRFGIFLAEFYSTNITYYCKYIARELCPILYHVLNIWTGLCGISRIQMKLRGICVLPMIVSEAIEWAEVS